MGLLFLPIINNAVVVILIYKASLMFHCLRFFSLRYIHQNGIIDQILYTSLWLLIYRPKCCCLSEWFNSHCHPRFVGVSPSDSCLWHSCSLRWEARCWLSRKSVHISLRELGIYLEHLATYR